MLSKASFRYQLFVFRRIFLQTSCCLVVSPTEWYLQVHKEIINLTSWFAVLYQCNYFIFLQRVCSKVILPEVLMGAPILLRHCNCDWLNHTTWSEGNCQRIPLGMVAAILFPEDHVMCDWLNHTTWFHSNRVLPWSMEFEAMLLLFFNTIQSPVCYVGCLMIANTWIYISLYFRNTAILENKKTVCIFSHQRVNNCDLHLHTS